MSTHHCTHSDEGPRKGTLFCPECGHQSAATGDWVARERRGRTVLTCPRCGAEVATRSEAPGLVRH